MEKIKKNYKIKTLGFRTGGFCTDKILASIDIYGE